VTGRNYTWDMLSLRSTDLGAFMPLIQQKRLVTGKEEGTRPQTVRVPAAVHV
jgi:hypothetical protein